MARLGSCREFNFNLGSTLLLKAIRGSHLWNEERNPTDAEITQVVMNKGDAFWYLGMSKRSRGKALKRFGLLFL